jgi:hypothetical protein
VRVMLASGVVVAGMVVVARLSGFIFFRPP